MFQILYGTSLAKSRMNVTHLINLEKVTKVRTHLIKIHVSKLRTEVLELDLAVVES